MRTTLDLPEDLLRKAMSVTNIESEAQVITFALQELIRKSESSESEEPEEDIDLGVTRGRR